MQSRDALNVTVWGEGMRVVLVHGSFSRGTEAWAEQRPLAEEYQPILVDRRGLGGSAPNGRVDFERDACGVAELLQDSAHLVGQSYGLGFDPAPEQLAGFREAT